MPLLIFYLLGVCLRLEKLLSVQLYKLSKGQRHFSKLETLYAEEVPNKILIVSIFGFAQVILPAEATFAKVLTQLEASVEFSANSSKILSVLA